MEPTLQDMLPSPMTRPWMVGAVTSRAMVGVRVSLMPTPKWPTTPATNTTARKCGASAIATAATTTTIAIVSMIVGAGRAADLPKIAQDLVQRSATTRGEAVAEVRSAVALTDEQIARLAGALKARTNLDITVKNVVDPTVMGGVVTQTGDSVLDGTVRTRLNQLREAF